MNKDSSEDANRAHGITDSDAAIPRAREYAAPEQHQTQDEIRASELTGPILNVVDVFRKHLEQTDPEHMIFWSRGRSLEQLFDQPSSENKIMVNAYRRIKNMANGLPENGRSGKGVSAGSFETLNSLIDPNLGGALMPTEVHDCTQIQEDLFWRTACEEYAHHATGTITMAVGSSPANSHLRMFEYPILMDNDNITNVNLMEGQVVPKHDVAVIPKAKPGTVEIISLDKYAADRQLDDGKRYLPLLSSIIPKLPLVSTPKSEWAEWQKQSWYNTSKQHLMTFLQHKTEQLPKTEDLGATRYLLEKSQEDIVAAEVRFIAEIHFSVKELERLEKSLEAAGDDPKKQRRAKRAIGNERARLSDALAIVEEHPFITDMAAPYNELEKRYAKNEDTEWETDRRMFSDGTKTPAFTQDLGHMFLQQDDTKTNAEKLALWGAFTQYRPENASKDRLPESYLKGSTDDMEAYTRDKISDLMEKAHAKMSEAYAREYTIDSGSEHTRKHTKVTIIGGGLSGIMAATKIIHHFLDSHQKNRDYSLEVTLVDMQEKLGGNTYNRYDVNVPMAQPVNELGLDNAGSFLKHMNRVVEDPKGTDRTPAFWEEKTGLKFDPEIDPKTHKAKGFNPKAFVTHNQYGHYVRTHLRSLREWVEKEGFPVSITTSIDPTANPLECPDKKVEYLKAEATDIVEKDGKHFVKIKKADGREEELESDVIVLATGNVAPRYLKDNTGQSLQGKAGYYNRDDTGLAKSNVNETDVMALIGMGNNAHFTILSALENGYKGKFLLSSTDGTTPELCDQPRSKPYTRTIMTVEACQQLQEQYGSLPADALWDLFKAEALEARKSGHSRHDVTDSAVPDFNKMWRMMDEGQQTAFRREHGTEWGHMRSRMPDIHNSVLKKLNEEGRILYQDGLVQNETGTGIRCDEEGGFWLQFKLTQRQQRKLEEKGELPKLEFGDHTNLRVKVSGDQDMFEVYVPKIINNMGPSPNLSDMSALVQNLEDKGIISQHPLGGMRVDDDLHAISADGKTQNVFYAVGPVISGDFHEAVTIPAIRGLAETLGEAVVKDHVLNNAMDFNPTTYNRHYNADGQIGYHRHDHVRQATVSVAL